MECQFWPSIVAATIGVIGALIAAIVVGRKTASASIQSVHKTFQEQRQLDEERREKIIRGVLQTFYDELDVTCKWLDEQVENCWKDFEKKAITFFKGKLWISDDCLTIYRSNASFIGQIEKPPELRSEIVRVYTLLQDLIEAYKINNNYLDKHEKAKTDMKEELAEKYHAFLMSYALELKKQHNNFRKSKEDLFKILREECNICGLAKDSK